ncbi:MAG: hypothetical protein AB1894_11325 [Chloroflexota bacterium]
MSIKNNPLTRQPLSLDPALQTHMSQEPDPSTQPDDPVYGRLAEQRARLRSMAPYQRRKAERDRKRIKVTFDWPPELRQQVQELARWNSVPASQLAALLVKVGLRALNDGKLNLHDYRKPARLPNFEWFLDLEKVDEYADIWKSWKS